MAWSCSMNLPIDKEDISIINDLSNELQIAAAFIEKDIYVTQALHSLSSLQNDYFKLIFQGGTCLSKAHQVIYRMSEDCDFKMEAMPVANDLSKEGFRRQLRVFRRAILVAIEQGGFNVKPEMVRARNSGQFMNVFLDYDAMFPPSAQLRSQVKLEFIAISSQLAPEKKSIATLIQMHSNDKNYQKEKSLDCVTVAETGAEKWVAFTRRVATIARAYRRHDTTLIRHLYDLYMLNQKNMLDERFFSLIGATIDSDINLYGTHNPQYTNAPIQEIKFALDQLNSDPKWEDDWEQFVSAMVFRQQAPSFHDDLNQVSQNVFKRLQTKA